MLRNKLRNKIEESNQILKQAVDEWDRNIILLCNFGKSCAVTLHLVRELWGEAIFAVLFIDHKQYFPEVYEFKEKLTTLWNLKILTVTPKKEYEEVKKDKTKCCYWLKTEPFFRIMNENRWKACCITTYSNDSQTAQSIVKRKDENFHHIYPLLHWSDADVWRYIRFFDLPYCPIYDKGYTTISCKACSQPVIPITDKSKEETVDKNEIFRRLLSLGYF